MVDVEQLGVDAWHVRGIALVVVKYQFDRTPQQSTLRIDLVGPDLRRQDTRLADYGEPADERVRKADGNWFGGATTCRYTGKQRSRQQHGKAAAGDVWPHCCSSLAWRGTIEPIRQFEPIQPVEGSPWPVTCIGSAPGRRPPRRRRLPHSATRP